MVFRGIGAGDEDDIGLLDIGDGVCHGATSECCGQTGHGGAMSEPGAMIDVVRLEHRPGKLVGDVVFFIGDAGRGEHAHAVSAVGIADRFELTGHQIDGLLPGGFAKCTVLFDQGIGEPLVAGDEIETEIAP